MKSQEIKKYLSGAINLVRPKQYQWNYFLKIFLSNLVLACFIIDHYPVPYMLKQYSVSSSANYLRNKFFICNICPIKWSKINSSSYIIIKLEYLGLGQQDPLFLEVYMLLNSILKMIINKD